MMETTDQSKRRYEEAIARFDAANRQDPNFETVAGAPLPKELAYAERMTRWLRTLAPDASEPLRLAARSQHIRRWVIPRSLYPEGKPGYKQWRTRLAEFHAETAGEILRQVGYDEATVARVRSLLLKKKLKTDPDAQTLEDAACLVFLEDYFGDFARKTDEAKLVDILRKTWFKMSENGHAHALRLKLAPDLARIVERALGGSESSEQA